MTRKLIFSIDDFSATENVEYDEDLVQADIEIKYIPRKNRTIPIITFVPHNFSKKALLALVDAVAETRSYVSKNHAIGVGFDLITVLNEFKDKDCALNTDTFTYEELITPLKPKDYNILGVQIEYTEKSEYWKVNATDKMISPMYDESKDRDDFMENSDTERMIDALIGIVDYLIDEKNPYYTIGY